MLFKSQAAKPGLHIILVGCGKVGSTIIEQLTKEGHDITVIDQNAQRIQDITNAYALHYDTKTRDTHSS